MWWNKSEKKIPLQYIEEPMSEFERARKESDGVWCTIEIKLTKNLHWVDWIIDVPDDLKKEAADALIMVVQKLRRQLKEQDE